MEQMLNLAQDKHSLVNKTLLQVLTLQDLLRFQALNPGVVVQCLLMDKHLQVAVRFHLPILQ